MKELFAKNDILLFSKTWSIKVIAKNDILLFSKNKLYNHSVDWFHSYIFNRTMY